MTKTTKWLIQQLKWLLPPLGYTHISTRSHSLERGGLNKIWREKKKIESEEDKGWEEGSGEHLQALELLDILLLSRLSSYLPLPKFLNQQGDPNSNLIQGSHFV